MKKQLVSVYGKNAAGEMELLHRAVTEEEGKKLADAYWRETGLTAAIVLCEDEKKPAKKVMSPSKFEDYLTERMDELDNYVHSLLRTFCMLPETGDDDAFPWNQEIIGEVSESIESILSERGFTFCRPYYTDDEGPCFWSDECKHKNCPFRKG